MDYLRWDTSDVVALSLFIQRVDGSPADLQTPEVSIRRILDANDAADDGYWWDGADFVAGETWLAMTEIGAENVGAYEYLFVQDGTPRTYRVQYRNGAPLLGGDLEIHKVEVDRSTLADSGLRSILVTVEDDDLDPIPSTLVDVFTAGGGTFLFRKVTDSMGQAAFTLDDGTYQIRLFAVGFAFDLETLVVAADATPTYTGTAAAGTPLPSSPELCVVYGTLVDAGGNPVAGADVNAYAVTPQVYAGAQAGDTVASATTDEAGYFELELVRLAVVRLQIETTGVDEERTVPDLANQDLYDWS